MRVFKARLYMSLLLAVLAVAALAMFVIRKTVTLEVDGQAETVTTYALTVGGLLRSQGLALGEHDALSPPVEAWLSHATVVTLQRAAAVQVLAGGELHSLYSSERLPTRLLAIAGFPFYPGDRLLLNGSALDAGQALAGGFSAISLQYLPAVSFTLSEDGQTYTLTTSAATLGQALWEAGYRLMASDRLTPPPGTLLTPALSAQLERARLLTIQAQAADISLYSAANTVGEALADASLSLQGLDYSLPAANEPVPSDGTIRLVRVREEVIIEQTPVEFETQYQPVADLEIDNQTVIQTGEYGLSAQRVRVRYEDDVETSRQVEETWLAREPQARIVGYGTLIVMHTTVVDGIEIQYWRALSMWATSYHPGSVGGSTRTATGTTLQHGAIAINPSYIPYGTRLYVPGYGFGTAEDTGRLGPRDIDLGYSDSDYVAWHQYVTVYFLWPPPANIVWIIP